MKSKLTLRLDGDFTERVERLAEEVHCLIDAVEEKILRHRDRTNFPSDLSALTTAKEDAGPCPAKRRAYFRR